MKLIDRFRVAFLVLFTSRTVISIRDSKNGRFGEIIVFEVQREGKIVGVGVFYNEIFQHRQIF